MLNIDPIVKVNVRVGTNTASVGTFDVGALITSTAGTGTPLTATSRYAVYESVEEVLSGVTDIKPAFANTTDVYKAASKYFTNDPAPAKLVVIYFNPGASTPELPAAAMLDAIDKGAEFYGVYYCPVDSETASSIKTNVYNISSALIGLNRGMEFYGFTGSVSSAIASGSILSDMAASASKRAIGMYCTTEVDDAAALMGAAMGLVRANEGTAFALCYKSVPAAIVNNVTQSEVESIKSLNGNVLVQRTKARAFLENGATASGMRFDEVLYVDMMAYDIQNGIYELIANSPAKLPQVDSTSVIFSGRIGAILDRYYDYGVLSEVAWRGAAVYSINTGDVVPHGHAEFFDSFDTQSVADRAAHKAMPITVIVCLSGSVETIVITVDVQT